MYKKTILVIAGLAGIAVSGLASAADVHTRTIASTRMSCHGPAGNSVGREGRAAACAGVGSVSPGCSQPATIPAAASSRHSSRSRTAGTWYAPRSAAVITAAPSANHPSQAHRSFIPKDAS